MKDKPSLFQWTLASIPLTVGIVMLAVTAMPSIRTFPELRNTEWKHVWGHLESVEGDEAGLNVPRVTYSYEVDGKTYTGTKVFAYSNAGKRKKTDTIKDVYAKAKRIGNGKDGKNPQIGVNYEVDDPGKSVLRTDYDFEGDMQTVMMYSTFCAVAVIGALVVLMWGTGDTMGSKQGVKMAGQCPKEPWNRSEEWRDGVIESSSGGCSLIAMPVGFFVFALTLVPTLGCVLSSSTRFPEMFALLIPAVGFLVFVLGTIGFLGSRKYGKTAFHLNTLPGVKGGQLSGVLVIPRALEAEAVRFQLRCDETTVGHGGKSSSSTRAIWTDDAVVREYSLATSRQTEIPVCFNIPYEVEPTSMHDTYPRYCWNVTATAATPGMDFNASFTVPVFETPDSDPDFDPDSCSTEYVESADEQTPEDVVRNAGLQKIAITGSETGLEIHMGGFRMKAICIIMPILTLVTIICPPISLFCFIYWMNMCFGSYRLRIDGNYLYYSHRLFGLGPSKTIPTSEVVDVHAIMHGRGNYKLQLSLADGMTVNVLPYIIGKRDAKAIGKLILGYCE